MSESDLLPAIGYGTAPLGGFRAPVSDEDAEAAAEAALEVVENWEHLHRTLPEQLWAALDEA